MKRHALTLALVFASLLLAGCAALDLQTPRVSLVGIDLEDVSLLESTLAVSLRIENPNAFRLPLERGVYTFWLGGDRIGTGATRGPLDIPARSSSRHQVVLQLDNRRLLSRLRSLFDREVDYRIEAEHYVRGFRRRPLQSVSEGEIDLRRALASDAATR